MTEHRTGIETERKFLISYPDPAFLRGFPGVRFSEMEQIYLLPTDQKATERVRKSVTDGVPVYTHTVKHRISTLSAEETEENITGNAYREFQKRADPDRSPIRKTRVCFPYEGFLFEIDLYPFWLDRAILEIELPEEETSFRFPPGIRIIREVSDDPRYKNVCLASSVPNDPI